jgi:SAM-dependent methyltransferase
MIDLMPRRTGDAEPPPVSMAPEHFEGRYRKTADPWNFRTSWYERRKYALTVASLPQEHYDSGYEAGCSIGEMTMLLAPRCRALLAVDCSPTAVRTAAAALREHAHVTVGQAVLPTDLPDATFDLVVATEILYYFTGADLDTLLNGLIERLRPGADLVIAHWRASDRSYGYDGFNVHDVVDRRTELDRIVDHQDENFVLTVHRRQARPARRPEILVSVPGGVE